MHAKRRQHYLSALGLSLWVPRKSLPFAAPSLLHFKPEDLENQPSASDDTSSAVQNATGLNQCSTTREALMASLDIENDKIIVPRGISTAEVMQRKDVAKKANVVPNEIDSDKLRKNNHQELKFELACFTAGDLLIVDDFTNFECASSAYWRWWDDVLSHLSLLPLQQWQRFHWPLPGKFIHENDAAAAKETLMAWFSRRMEGQAYRQILLMGQAPRYWLLDDDALPLGKWHTIAALPVPVLCSYSTSSLWQQPLRKRDFWRHLMLLRSSMSSESVE